MTDYTNLDFLFPIAGIISSVILGAFSLKWIVAKRKISLIRKLIVRVDDALQDDKISEQEFRDIFSDFMELVNDGKKS